MYQRKRRLTKSLPCREAVALAKLPQLSLEPLQTSTPANEHHQSLQLRLADILEAHSQAVKGKEKRSASYLASVNGYTNMALESQPGPLFCASTQMPKTGITCERSNMTANQTETLIWQY